MIRRILLGFVVVIALVAAAGTIFVASRQHLRFQAPYPPVRASADPAVIERGRYVIRELAGCPTCHGDPTLHGDLVAGKDVPLSGGRAFEIPPGAFFARNITPDPETGIGSFPDSAIARALRYGVGHDGRALLPFMEMQGLSDEDLHAVVSYLRVQPPVRNVVPAHRPNLLGRIVIATVLSSPVGPKATPPVATPHGPTAENGRYLVESVALCGACHTQRDMRTGAFTGPHLAGATGVEDAEGPGRVWSPPNITRGGKLAGMSETDFVARMRTGRVIPGSPMPWQSYSRLAEEDLRAIYRYLLTVPPSTRDVGQPVTFAQR